MKLWQRNPRISAAGQKLCCLWVSLMQEQEGGGAAPHNARAEALSNLLRPLPSLPPTTHPSSDREVWGSHKCFYSRPREWLKLFRDAFQGPCHVIYHWRLEDAVQRSHPWQALGVKIQGQETAEPGPEHPAHETLLSTTTLFLSRISLADSPHHPASCLLNSLLRLSHSS